MNGWKYEWIDELDLNVYEILIDWLEREAKEANSST